jgi:hypothetical protein
MVLLPDFGKDAMLLEAARCGNTKARFPPYSITTAQRNSRVLR